MFGYLLFFGYGIMFGLALFEFWRSRVSDFGPPNPSVAIFAMIFFGSVSLASAWSIPRMQDRNEQKVREYLQNESYDAGYEDGYSAHDEEHGDEIFEDGYDFGYADGYEIGFEDGEQYTIEIYGIDP